jgi:predicted SnoaL-like aldol condensation-catalyzing enzyme
MNLLERLFIAHPDRGESYIAKTVMDGIAGVHSIAKGERYKMFEYEHTSNHAVIDMLMVRFVTDVKKADPEVQCEIVRTLCDVMDEEEQRYPTRSQVWLYL